MTNLMKRPVGLIALAAVSAWPACSRRANPEALAELQKMSSAVQDMNVVVSVGAAEAEYSRRLTDALIKFGNLDETCKRVVPKFATPNQQTAAAEICQHLGKAMGAYTSAKQYMGPGEYLDGIGIWDNSFPEKEYANVREEFPTLPELPVAETNEAGYKFYDRSAMLQALWKVAGQEWQAAKELIERLAQAEK